MTNRKEAKKEYDKIYRKTKNGKQVRIRARKKYAQTDKGKQSMAYIKKSSQKKYRIKLKQEVIQYYGGKCECCGENYINFLTIDHVNGGGRKHRKEINIQGGWKFYEWLKKNGYPEGFRVLCFNCNCHIGAFGYCIHQGEIL
jgi:hypothetical protein